MGGGEWTCDDTFAGWILHMGGRLLLHLDMAFDTGSEDTSGWLPLKLYDTIRFALLPTEQQNKQMHIYSFEPSLYLAV